MAKQEQDTDNKQVGYRHVHVVQRMLRRVDDLGIKGFRRAEREFQDDALEGVHQQDDYVDRDQRD